MKFRYLLLLSLFNYGYLSSEQADFMPMLSRFYGDFFTPQVHQVPKWSDNDNQYVDITDHADINLLQPFGQNNRGYVIPWHGFSGPFLQQKIKHIFKTKTGQFLLGIDGKLDDDNHHNMILTAINAQGSMDDAFGMNGSVHLPRYQTEEYLTDIVQDFMQRIIVLGYGDQGSIVRCYNQAGHQIWRADHMMIGSFVQSCAVQKEDRLLVAHQIAANKINLIAYNLTTGAIDEAFHSTGHRPGIIESEDFGLHIGYVHNIFVVDSAIVILYTNDLTGMIDMVLLSENGQGLFHVSSCHRLHSSLISNIFSHKNDIKHVHAVCDLQHRHVIVVGESDEQITVIKICLGHTMTTSTFCLDNPNIEIKKIVYLVDDSILLLGCNKDDSRLSFLKINKNGLVDVDFAVSNQHLGIADPRILDNKTEKFINFYCDNRADQILISGCILQYDQYLIPMIMPLSCSMHSDSPVFDVIDQALPTCIDIALEECIDLMIDCSNYEGWDILIDFTACAIQANKDGTAYVLFSNGIKIIIGLLDSFLRPVITYGNAGLSKMEELPFIHSFYVDSKNRIIVAGKDLQNQKVIRYDQFGAIDKVLAVNNPIDIKVFGEQQSGAIIGTGTLKNQGAVYGYQNTGDDFIASFGSIINKGYFTLDSHCHVDAMVIDNQDALFMAWQDCWTHRVFLEKSMPNGSKPVANFNNGMPIATDIFTNDSVFLAINQDQNIAIAACTDKGLEICLYDGNTGQALAPIQILPVDHTCVIQNLVGAGTNFVGMCTTSENTIIFRFLGAEGVLDTLTDDTHPGIIFLPQTYDTFWYDFSIQSDGKIVLVGQKAGCSSLLRLSGYDDFGEHPQVPGKAPAGTIDTTLFYNAIAANSSIKTYKDTPGSVDTSYGAFNFNTISVGSCNLADSVMQRLHVYQDGRILCIVDNGIDTIIFRVLSDFSLDTLNNGGTGFNQLLTPGYIKLTGLTDVTSLHVDEQGVIFVAGGLSNIWAKVYNPDGSSLSSWQDPVDGFATKICQIGRQTCGRYLMAGKGSVYGAVYGYTPSGQLDESFGLHGVFQTGVTAEITDMFIDAFDRIIISYVVEGSSVIERISTHGLSSIVLGAHPSIDGIIENELRIAQDTHGNIVLAAATYDGFSLRYYDDVGLGIVTTPIDIVTDGAGTCHLGNIVVTNNKIIFVGYQTIDHTIICARLAADFNFDIDFNGGAPLVTTNPPMNIVRDVSMYTDARILIVGGSSTTPGPYMMRVFGDTYGTIQSHSPFQGIKLTHDQTFGQPGTLGVICYGLTGGSSQDQVARTIALYDDQNVLIGLDGQSLINTENRIFLNMVTLEGNGQERFGVGGKVEIPHMYEHEYIQDMILLKENVNDAALLAGYIKNNRAGITNSLLMKYNLMTQNIDTNFGGFSGDPQGIASGHAQKYYKVSQQSQGRIIVSGVDQLGHGVLVGYTPQGRLDKSFGLDGIYYQGPVGLYGHCIDSQNRIIIAYNDGSNNIAVARITADGSHLDTIFNGTGCIDTEHMISGVAGNENFQIALDQNAHIVVAAAVNNQVDVQVSRYHNDGTFDTTIIISSTMLGGIFQFMITKLLIDTQGNITIIGYDQGALDAIIVIHVLSDLSGLDSLANFQSTPGYFKYATTSDFMQRATDALICSDGRICIVGNRT